MIRIILFLIVVGALAFGVTWLADRPAELFTCRGRSDLARPCVA